MGTQRKTPNKLIHEKSPYLLQHAYNPVAWYPWGKEAFERAREEDKPVFLSIGYSTCHWCHVMERESFEDEEVAALLNERFISVKVDREERPDVDHLYMEACMAFTGQGGWPLTAFLDDEKRPFFAGTYFPKQDSYGRIGFLSLLQNVSSAWAEEREALLRSGREVLRHLDRSPLEGAGESGDPARRLYEQLKSGFDDRYGGFGGAPKFPSVQNLLFLLRYGSLHPESGAGDMALRTLWAMAEGGIFDHVGGGFCRYSTDRLWLVPHFEKMLYDNAMLLTAYGEASAADSRLAGVAQRIVEFCFERFSHPEGGFYTAWDADTEGEEGTTYLWTPAQVTEALGTEEGEWFCREYDITEEGNFEGRSIPNRIGRGMAFDDRHRSALGKLKAVRDRRVQPRLDDKILASGNGLMIAGLSAAGRLLNRPDWVARAAQAVDFVLDRLVVNGRLMARWRDGEAAHPATLEDYAYFVWGLLELYEAEHSFRYLSLAQEWTRRLLELFGSGGGALTLSGGDVSDLPLRQVSVSDSALPSGNAVAAMNLLRLGLLTGEEEFTARAGDILRDAAGEMDRSPLGYAGLVTAALLRDHGGTLTAVDGDGEEALLEAAAGYHPFVFTLAAGERYGLPEEYRKQERSADGRSRAYLCGPRGCLPPVTEKHALEALLKENKHV